MTYFTELCGKDYNLLVKKYCQNATCRKSIINDFDVRVDNHSCLPIGCSLYSSIQGGKPIKDDVIVLRAMNTSARKYINFVFPEKMGVNLLKTWEMKIPPKMTVYKGENDRTYYYEYSHENEANFVLRVLIEYLNALHLWKRRYYIPLPYRIIKIYERLYECPGLEIDLGDVYYINDVIRQELETCDDLVCQNLMDFVEYMQSRNAALPYKDADFSILRRLMYQYYGSIKLYF